MMGHQGALPERRRDLVERSAAQRAAIVVTAEPLMRAAGTADRVVSRVRRYPIPVAALAGAVLLFGGRRLFDLASRAITLYALFRR
jgi:hypothetical protein